MELHLRDHIEDLIAEGHSEKSAFEAAVKEFGDIKPMAKEEYWNLRLKSSLNRAMIKNYLKITLRNFRKHKSYAFVNIFGLTIGLTIVLLIGLFVSDELGFDQFHANKADLYRVVENQYYAGQPVFPVAVTPTALAPSLHEEYPEIVKATRIAIDADEFELGGNKIMENEGIMVDPHFFEMFSFPMIDGSIASFFENLNGLILTEELANKYFPDKNPIGELIRLNGQDFEVMGIAEDVPKNSHLSFRYIKNFQNYLAGNPDRANNWLSNWLYTYVQLDPAAVLDTVNNKVIGHIKANNESSVTDIYLQPLTDIYLGDVDFTVEVSRKGEMMYVRIFIVVALFILLISCINFMNLSTARSAKRAKEVGLRKTVGANRNQLIVQFLTESVVFTLVAVVLAIVIVAILLPSFNQLTSKEFSLQMLVDPEFGIQLGILVLFSAFITGLLAGSYPAVFLSSIRPILTLNAQNVTIKQGAGLRKLLVVVQFTISVILIVGTLVVYKQLQFIQDVDLGYSKEHVIYTFVPSRQSTAFANEVRNQRGVVSVARSNRHPAYVLSSSSGFTWSGKDPDETILFHYMGIDEHYVSTMELRIREGRDFFPTDTSAVMINERALEIMGLENPLGQTIDAFGDRTIVGVLENFNFKSIHSGIEPMIIFMIPRPSRVYIKYDPAEEENIAATLDEVWKEFFPNAESEYYFLDKDFNEMYEAEQRTSRLSTYFAILAVLISCLGLFGLVSYAIEQRTKEIGIRKVLGASVPRLFVLLTTDFTKLVLVSLLVSLPVGWFSMNKWLDNYAYRIDLSIWIFVFAAAIALFIALFTVSYQSVRASVRNPVNALRND